MSQEKLLKVYQPRKINVFRAIGYGLPDIMGGGAFTIIGAWLLFFWTTYADLSAVEASSILGIARIVDACISLIMGSITDNLYRTRIGRKLGRRHFFLLIGSPLMLTFILMWVTGMSYWYYLVSYLLFEIVAAMVLIPWETLPTEMTEDYTKRTMFSTTRMIISSTGVFLATFVPGQLFKFFGENSAAPFLYNAVFFALIYVICVFITYSVTWERQITPEIEKELQKTATHGIWKTLKKQLKDYVFTLKVKSFRKHLIIYLLSFTSKDVFNAVFAYYCVSALMVSSTTSANVLSLSFMGPFIMFISGFLMVKFGPRWLYSVSYSCEILALCGFCVLFATKPSNVVILLFVFGFLYNIGLAILQFVPWNVFPLIPDLDEIITKQHREGIYAAVMTFVRKSTIAVATVCVGFLLDMGGYVKGSIHQSVAAQRTIVAVLVGGTGILLLCALLEAQTFHLNKKTHEVVKNELLRLRAGGDKNDVDPETRKIVEDLTGYKWKNIWKDESANFDFHQQKTDENLL